MLLHGLTATRRYVVMGSRALERSGHRVVAYDARGHGRSSPAPEPSSTATSSWPRTCDAVLDALRARRARCWRAPRWAPTRRCASRSRTRARRGARADHAVVRPGRSPREEQELARWDALARGLREGGVEGFVARLRPRRGARALARDGRDACCASASPRTSTRSRWPMRSKSCRARARSSEPASELARDRGADRRRRQPRRGRPRAPAGGRPSATRRVSPARGWLVEEPPARSPHRLARRAALARDRGAGRRRHRRVHT